MLAKDIEQIEAMPYGENALKRRVFAAEDGVPTFAMRIFDVAPGGASSRHSHDFEHEVLILKGEGVLKGEKGDIPFKAGTALYIEPNELHQLRNTGTDTLRFLCMVPLRGEEPAPTT